MDTIGMISSYGQGRQDLLLNPLAFGLKLVALIRMRYNATGQIDKTSELMLGISDHINSSRFTLRFLVGLSNLHALITEASKVQHTFTLFLHYCTTPSYHNHSLFYRAFALNLCMCRRAT